MLTIGQAARLAGVPPKTIRYYEQIGLVAPGGRGDNLYRQYDDDDVAVLTFIGRARALGFTLKEVERLLDLYRNPQRSSRDVRELALSHVRDIDQRIRELKSLRQRIADLADRCDGQSKDCPILEELIGAVVSSEGEERGP